MSRGPAGSAGAVPGTQAVAAREDDGAAVPPPPAATMRQPVDVAVGVLVRPDGAFLLTSRPPGKVYAGYWEFPGGKLEPGESVEQALSRELHEEIGVTIGTVRRWRVQEFDYPHARVRLHFCKVFDWDGEIQMREGQQMAWQRLPSTVEPLLPGTVPVLQWMAEEGDRPSAVPA